jgi:hypothetical protein
MPTWSLSFKGRGNGAAVAQCVGDGEPGQHAKTSRPYDFAEDADILRALWRVGDERRDLHREAQIRDEAVKKVPKRRFRPNMEMNAVIGRFESIHGGFQLLSRMPHHQRRKFTYVSVVRPFRPLDVIAQHVSEVGLRSRLVECEPPVRHRHIEHSAGAQHLEMPLNGANRILSMFEEMIGDDEILTIRFERGQFFSIIDDIHLYERQVVQFRVMTTQVIFIHTINVGHTASWRNPQWIMQGADLDPATRYEPLC